MRTPTRLALLITALVVLLPLAHGGKLSLQYNVDRRVIRVCNLLVPPNYTNHNPFVFMALQHSPLKPEGWEFDNPLAVPYVQDQPGIPVDMFDQWQNAGHAPDGGSGPTYWGDRGMAAGSPISKSWPQYWEVYFTGWTAERLRDYDLIYVSADTINLPGALRSALIDAVEGGATLWIDSGGGYTTGVVNLMPPRVGADGSGNFVPFTFVAQAPDPAFQRRNPLWNAERNSDLFRTPLVITDGERYALGDLPEPGTACDGSYISVPASPRPDQDLVPVLYTLDAGSGTSYPTIAACQYGAGRIVVSANGVGDDVEEWMRQGRTAPDAYQAPDVKLAYNIAAWGTSWVGGRQSSVNTGYTAASLLPPLDIAWQFPHPDADPTSLVIGSVVAAPVVSHGRVYAVSLISDAYPGGTAAPALLMCFDADPARDLDGDGEADDAADLNGDGSPDPAFFDYRFGRPYDLVWARPLNDLSAMGSGTSTATPRWAGATACNLPDGTFAVLCSFVSQTGDSPNGFVAAVNGETGENLWLFEATPFDVLDGGSNAQVRDISTPVVHRGWVYFTCSEFDPDLVPAAPLTAADATYGRAWCIDLQTGGGSVAPPAWFTEWGVWCFPDADLNDNGAVAPADLEESERAGLLPPFAEPKWVAGMFPVENGIGGQPRQLPPDPGMLPAITTHTRNAMDRTEAVMVVGAPVSMRYSVADDAIRVARNNLGQPFEQVGNGNERSGGRDLALAPTPGRVVGGTMEWFLNRNYYRLYMNQDVGAATDISQIARHDDASFVLTAGWMLESARIVVIDPDKARYLLAAYLGGSGAQYDPTSRVSGTNVDVTFTTPPPDPQLAYLRGPVPWNTEYSPEERRIAPGAIREEKLFAVTTIPDADDTAPPPPVPAWRTARVVSQDLRIGAREWQFDPVTMAPGWLGVTNPQGRSKSAPAVGQDTVLTAMTLTPTAADAHTVSGVFGTRTTPLLTVSLCSKPSVPDNYRIARGVPNPGDALPHNKPVTVAVWRNGGWQEVEDWQYEVDYEEATITFHWETAWNIRLVTGAWAGHIYGEPLRITWRWHNDSNTPDDTADDVYGWSDAGPMDELYTVTPLARFAYVPPCIKLRYYPVDVASITIRTADGTPVSGWTPGEATMPYDLDGDGTDELLLPRGWIYLGPEDDNENGAIDDIEDRNGNGVLDPSAFLDVNGNGVLDAGVDELLPPGIELEVSYRGFANEWGIVAVPNPALNIGWERHQAPVGFGAAASATGMAGSAIHVGTEGYLGGDVDGDGRREFRTPPGATSPDDTLLSLVWEPASNMVRGWMTAAADLGNYRTNPLQIPATTGSPALAPDGLFVGSRIMDDESFGQSVGFVSRLGPRKTLVVDASRVVECSGQEVDRELTGTQSWEYGQAAGDRPVQLALNHPSKVTSLGGGNLLIVDTGNNRVVETDSSGNVLWPLGEAYEGGPIVNWYSSPLNADLQLRRPSDAQRLTSVYDINGDGTAEQVIHTLIADAGNDRVLHVRSWWEWDAAQGRWEQRHRVQRVTPEYVPDPADRTRRAKGHYTHVAAIPHPDPTFSNPATANAVGYMCAAPNLREIVVMGFWALTDGGAVQFGLDPPADSYLPGAGAPLWSLWSWLYDDPTDAAVQRDNPLLFAGLRHMELQRLGDVVYLDLACEQYQGRLSNLTGGPAYASLVGPVAIEFRVSYLPGALGLIPAAPGGTADPDRPIWDFTQTDYNDPTGGAGPAYWSYFRLPLPNGTTYFKRFLPTCVKLLPTGHRLIVNNSGLIERLTKQALGRTGVVCSSEVLEITTTGDDDDLPGNDVHDVDGRRLIPDPYGAEWRDPLVAPVYAERVVR